MSKTMRAVDIKGGAGPATSLFLNDQIERPTPKSSECLIRVRCFGLNRADTLQREGKYPIPPGVTRVMGLEFSGNVEEVGSDGQGDWKKGQEVFGLCYGGAYAEFVAVEKGMLIHKPKELSWECCGGLCEVWMTALQAMYLVGAYEAETTTSVLWHAGGSAVSIAGQQLSKHANAGTSYPQPKVFVTARQDEKIDWCKKQLGADGGANTKSSPSDWAEKVKEANDGQGVDLLIDFIGSPVFQQNLEVMNLDGRIVQLGVMGGTSLSEGTDIGAFVRKRVRFMGSTLRSRKPDYQRKLRDIFVEKALPELVEGKFENHIDTVMSWKQIGEAHAKMERNETKGKIVCTVD